MADPLILASEISRIFHESTSSSAMNNRKLKELKSLHSSSPSKPFFEAFLQALGPIFDFPRRTPTAERSVRLAASFASICVVKGSEEDEMCFLEEFLRFLLVGTQAARAARLRSCQIISEIIMRLPDDAEVSDEVWDDVIERMKIRVGDKIPAVRAFAIRALSRFADTGDDTDISDLFLEILPLEQNPEVRKTIVLSLPSSSTTIESIIESTLDVSETVRKAAYCVVASKFPLESLSIKHRTTLLKRGLKDRSSGVKKECLQMLKDDWLTKFCKGDPINLLKYLDVETYESIGEDVMEALLNDDVIKVQEGESIRKYVVYENQNEGEANNPRIELMDAETALYWRVVCKHLQAEANAKGSEAATTTGTEAAVYASEASDKNDLLEGVLPASISDYVSLVNAHLSAGQNHHFTSRQLLLLGSQLDFSDTSTRKSASSFLLSLLLTPPPVDQSPLATSSPTLQSPLTTSADPLTVHQLFTSAGDGVSLGGDRAWARAVAELARRVHASKGEFEEMVLGVADERARPCRERVGGFADWMHCLSLIGFLLENVQEGFFLREKGVEALEILNSLLLPAAKHTHIEIQRAAMRHLFLFGKLEKKPSTDIIKQLYNSFINAPSPVSAMACKSLIDLVTWFGPDEINKAVGLDSNDPKTKTSFSELNEFNEEESLSIDVLDLLYSGFDRNYERELGFEADLEEDNVISVLGEGFTRILLLSGDLCINEELCPVILSRLVRLYFDEETGDLHRLKQCLSVFFQHYPALSPSHKRCVSSAFIPVIRAMWPGMFGNDGGNNAFISKMRKRALMAAKFMLQMIQTPFFSNQIEEGLVDDFEFEEEGLAIRISAEIVSYTEKTNASKSYVSSLCKILVMLRFRVSEQKAIKCMRGMINLILTNVSHDKDAIKEIARLGLTLKSLDQQINEEMNEDQVNEIFAKLGIEGGFKLDTNITIPPTPIPQSSRRAPRARSRHKQSSSSNDDPDNDDDVDVTSSLQHVTPGLASRRSERASKAAAMSKIANSVVRIQEELGSDEEEESGVTEEESEDESEEDFES